MKIIQLQNLRLAPRKTPWTGILFLLVGLGEVLLGFLLLSKRSQENSTNSNRQTFAPNSFSQLCSHKPSELSGIDIALVNLLCTEDLPNSTGADPAIASNTLDTWVRRVETETARNFHQFRQNPGEFNNSEPYFRMLALVTVLQQDFGVRYNPERVQSPDYKDSRDLFLHGILGPERQGTCLSMPVLYVAIGRRLGYPLKLVATKAHLFARWESADGKERLNLEGTNQGLNCFSDDYYRSWPVPVTDAEIQQGLFLKSLSPAEELAVFLSARGHCLEANGRYAEAQLAQAQAHALVPNSPVYLAFLVEAVQREMPEWRQVQVDLGQNQFSTRGSN